MNILKEISKFLLYISIMFFMIYSFYENRIFLVLSIVTFAPSFIGYIFYSIIKYREEIKKEDYENV